MSGVPRSSTSPLIKTKYIDKQWFDSDGRFYASLRIVIFVKNPLFFWIFQPSEMSSMWNQLEQYVSTIQLYITGWGKIWNVNHFILRLFLLTIVGDELYDDEMSSFVCDTSQPGCRNVCFNKFSPMSHSRFWAAHVLFTAFPVLFFYAYAIQKTSLIRKYQYNKQKLDQLESNKGQYNYTYDACLHALDYRALKSKNKSRKSWTFWDLKFNPTSENVGQNDFERGVKTNKKAG